MPTRARVSDFVDAVVHGDHADAIALFYTEHASMQENDQPPRQGRDVLIAHERKALSRIREIRTHPPHVVLIDGDQVAIHWTFDAVGKDGVTRRLTEVAMQIWSGDRIVSEQFFYDTATAWQSVAPHDDETDNDRA
ncbi:MAG: nuclear transport factor 2 family protein [Pseudomonadota bacterium]